MSTVPPPPQPIPQTARDRRLAASIFSPWRLEQSVIRLLQIGLPTYLDEAAYQDGGDHDDPRPVVERPRSWERHDDIDGLPDDQLPRVIVINQGTVRRPDRDADGIYSAVWLLTVAAVVYHPEHGIAKRAAGAYAGAIDALMTHHAALSDPLIRDVTWVGAANPTLSSGMDRQRRLLAATRQDFEVTVDRVITDMAGPLRLPDPVDPNAPVDLGDAPVVTDVEFKVDAR